MLLKKKKNIISTLQTKTWISNNLDSFARFYILYKWNLILHIILCLASFAPQHVCRIHLYYACSSRSLILISE